MAGFTLKFDAQTSGNYKIAYKDADDPCAVYQYKEVYVNNQSYPHEVSVNIEIEGSLYCDNITYEGWVLPMCFGEVYQPGQTVPDHATTFTHVISQITNNCEKIDVTLKGYQISWINVDDSGSGYTYSDPPTVVITRDPNDATDIEFQFDANNATAVINNSGQITGVMFDNEMSDINARGTYDKNNPPSISIVGGTFVDQASLSLTVETTGRGIKASDVEQFACSTTIGDNTTFALENVNDTISLCGNVTTARQLISNNYDVVSDGCCYCEECHNVTIDATAASTGYIEYSYNKCWDESGVTTYFAKLNSGESITLTNVILSTFFTFNETLDVSAVITHD